MFIADQCDFQDSTEVGDEFWLAWVHWSADEYLAGRGGFPRVYLMV